MLIRVLVALTLGFALTGAAMAQTPIARPLPADAKRGYLSHVRENILSLDGKQIKLAPGGQIRGANNLIIVPTALPKNSLVKYQLDASGQLFRAWILTKEEAARPDPAAASDDLDKGRPFSEITSPQAPPADQPKKP